MSSALRMHHRCVQDTMPGMQSSDAKYKVYLHHDVFIKEPKFIFYLLERFRSAPDVGMIGMVGGCGRPKIGVAYLAWNKGTVDCREPDFAYQLICDPAAAGRLPSGCGGRTFDRDTV